MTTPGIAALLVAGKLEKTCRACGRWEAASPRCSWCTSPCDPADFYRNNDAEARAARLPSVAPANPPTEFRSVREWPAMWGACPYQRAPRQATGPISADLDGGVATLPKRPRGRPRSGVVEACAIAYHQGLTASGQQADHFGISRSAASTRMVRARLEGLIPPAPEPRCRTASRPQLRAVPVPTLSVSALRRKGAWEAIAWPGVRVTVRGRPVADLIPIATTKKEDS
jgi:hypothetical protein